MAKLVTADIGSFSQAAVTTINQNFAAVEAAMEKTLSRDGTIPNQMAADLDLNGNDLINVGTVDAAALLVEGQPLDVDYLESIVERAEEAAQEIEDAVVLAEAWAEGIDPEGPSTKSAKQWAELSQDYAEDAATYVGQIRFNTVAALIASTRDGAGAGTLWQASIHLYEELASSATTYDVITAGGVKLDVVPDTTGRLNVLAFGAVDDDATDSRDAFISASKRMLSSGYPVFVPKGRFFWSAPIEFSNTAIGSYWRNILIEGTVGLNPYTAGVSPTLSRGTQIRVNASNAIKIVLESPSGSVHQQIRMKGIDFVQTIGQPRTGLKAIEIYIDGNRGFDYPMNWYFDELNFRNFEDAFRFTAANISNVNHRYIGQIEMNRVHVNGVDNFIANMGCYLNFLHITGGMSHSRGTIHTGSNGGGFYFITNRLWQSSRPARFTFDANALITKVSIHNLDGETNGEGTGEPYDNGFVQFLGTQTTTHEFVLTGFCRLPGFGENPPEVPAIALSAYTDIPIRIIPKGTVIKTPETIQVVPPTTLTTHSSRHFRFFVPLDVAKKYDAKKHVAAFNQGIRSTGSAHRQIKRSKFFPYMEPVAAGYNGQSLFNTDLKPMFASSYIVDCERNVTRPWGNPVAVTISGSALNNSLSPEAHTGNFVCVYGVTIDPSSETLDSFTVAPTGQGSDYPVSAALGSWYESGQAAADYLIPAGLPQFVTRTIANSASASIRVPGTNTGAITQGISGTLRVDVNDGLLGSAAWRFEVTSAGLTQTELWKNLGSGVTTSITPVSAYDMAVATVSNATGDTISVTAHLSYDPA